MKRMLILLACTLLSACNNDDGQIQELKTINAEQRRQVDRALESQKAASDQLAVQLSRQAQSEAEQKVSGHSQELSTATMIVLGCALAATLTVIVRRRGTHANQSGK